jgi:hypothetical protein
MLDNFARDLAIGKKGEEIVLNTFSKLTTEYKFESISDMRCFFYRGDIKAVDKSGKEIFIEVKNDSRIADTGNILCEEEVYYKNNDYIGKGNMFSDNDIFAVVSQPEKKIYVVDFKILKANYRKGEYREIEHPQQTSYCYLMPVSKIKKLGGLIAVVDYAEVA